MALADDSPQFQKHLAALVEQVRGVKHNSQKLIQASAAYFAAGNAFVEAGHQFAQDMLRYAPYQKEEWELQKGIAKGNKKQNEKLNQKTMKDLEEDENKTRKLQIIAEELTLLIREGMVHLDVLLSQQEEILIKPLEHLVTVDSKVCKQMKERYDREKKIYLNALSRYQSMKKNNKQKINYKKEVDLHANIFEDSRFECALKLGTFHATRDTSYLERLAQWVHVLLSFFTHGEKKFGERSPWFINSYKAIAISNETCDSDANTLKKEYAQWKLSGSKMYTDKKSSTAAMFGTGNGLGRRSVTPNVSDLRDSETSNDMNRTMHYGSSNAAFKEGYLMIRSKTWKNKWKRRWFTCDGRQFFYCKTAEQDAVRAAEIDLTLASVRMARKVPRDFCFEVVSSSPGGGLRIMVLQAASAEELNDWIKTITAGISAQLDALLPSDVSGTASVGNSGKSNSKSGSTGVGTGAEGAAQRERQLTVITETPGNSHCADCGNVEGVEWCSLNLGVVCCLECAGVHRGLGVHISQCRSFKLDVMDESILSMFAAIGNTVANAVWEEHLPNGEKPTSSSSRKEKETYIQKKYVERLFVNKIFEQNSTESHEALIDAAAKGDMKKLLYHIAWKTNLDFVSEHGGTSFIPCTKLFSDLCITLLTI
jgi:hypothetical protein